MVVHALVVGWFLELLICTPKWDFKIVVSLHVLCIEKKREKTKRKEKRIKKRNKKEFVFEHCVRTELKLEVLVFGITFMID